MKRNIASVDVYQPLCHCTLAREWITTPRDPPHDPPRDPPPSSNQLSSCKKRQFLSISAVLMTKHQKLVGAAHSHARAPAAAGRQSPTQWHNYDEVSSQWPPVALTIHKCLQTATCSGVKSWNKYCTFSANHEFASHAVYVFLGAQLLMYVTSCSRSNVTDS